MYLRLDEKAMKELKAQGEQLDNFRKLAASAQKAGQAAGGSVIAGGGQAASGLYMLQMPQLVLVLADTECGAGRTDEACGHGACVMLCILQQQWLTYESMLPVLPLQVCSRRSRTP